ncbi:MAG: hypothetical protein H6739_37340 [Alphaproteobacteria bacterium]|nr:hypothetical protein [Alphaproteobacteria bacterium]
MPIDLAPVDPSSGWRRLAVLALALWCGVAHAAPEDIAAEVVAEIRAADHDPNELMRPWLAQLDAEEPAARVEAEAVLWGVLDGLVAWEQSAWIFPRRWAFNVEFMDVPLVTKIRMLLTSRGLSRYGLSPDAQAVLVRWSLEREPMPSLRLQAFLRQTRAPTRPEALLLPALGRPSEPKLLLLAIEQAVDWEVRAVEPELRALLDHPADAVREDARAALLGWGLDAPKKRATLPPELEQALLDTARVVPRPWLRELRDFGGGQLDYRDLFMERWIEAAYALQRGHRAGALRRLGPILGKLVHWTEKETTAADLGMVVGFVELVDRFAERRDYDAAMETLARLTDPFFQGIPGHRDAVTLAAQLPHREMDFDTLTLPTLEEWAALTDALGRAEQIRYLAARLQIYHSHLARWGSHQRGCSTVLRFPGPEVVDPYETLLDMQLQGIEDARALVEALGDPDLTLTPLFREPFRTQPYGFYAVNDLAANLFIDATLHLDIIRPLMWAEDDAARDQARAALLDWLDAHQGWSRERLAWASVREGDAVATDAAGELRQQAGVASALLENVEALEPLGYLSAALYGLDDPVAVPYARTRKGDRWAALILARHVPEEREAEIRFPPQYREIPFWFAEDRALFLERVDASEPAALIEARAMLSTDEPDLAAVHRLLWRGEAEAFAAVDAALAEGRWEPRRGPSLRGSLAGWSGLTDPSVGALRAWLAARAAEARAGRPVGMARPLPIWPAGCDARVPQSCD